MFGKLTKLLKAGEGKNLKRYEDLIKRVNELEAELSRKVNVPKRPVTMQRHSRHRRVW